MRTKASTRFATTLLMVGSLLLLSGCGDEGAHLPAGMMGGSTYASSQGSDLLGGDPGPLDGGVRSGVDDPVLTDTTGLDELGSLASDDPFQRAVSDWNDGTGSLGGGIDDIDLDAGLDDDFLPAGYDGYGYGDGYGFDDGYGYGGNVLAAASYGGVGMDAGLIDPGFDDPGMIDAGLEDPGFIDGGFDAGFIDAGMDVGFVDAGFDAGFDPGFADVGFSDVGFDAGFDPGFADVGSFDVGGFDAGGFDAGFGF